MAYLDREAVARFHTMFPMSRKAKTVLMNHLEVLKDQGRLFTEVRKREGLYDANRY